MGKPSGSKVFTTGDSDLAGSPDLDDYTLYFQKHKWLCTKMAVRQTPPSPVYSLGGGNPVQYVAGNGNIVYATFEAQMDRHHHMKPAGLTEQMEKLRSLVRSNPDLNEQYERWENAKILVDLL